MTSYQDDEELWIDEDEECDEVEDECNDICGDDENCFYACMVDAGCF